MVLAEQKVTGEKIDPLRAESMAYEIHLKFGSATRKVRSSSLAMSFTAEVS